MIAKKLLFSLALIGSLSLQGLTVKQQAEVEAKSTKEVVKVPLSFKEGLKQGFNSGLITALATHSTLTAVKHASRAVSHEVDVRRVLPGNELVRTLASTALSYIVANGLLKYNQVAETPFSFVNETHTTNLESQSGLLVGSALSNVLILALRLMNNNIHAGPADNQAGSADKQADPAADNK